MTVREAMEQRYFDKGFDAGKSDFCTHLYNGCVKLYSCKGLIGLTRFEEGVREEIQKLYEEYTITQSLSGYERAADIRTDKKKYSGVYCGRSNWNTIFATVCKANCLFKSFD